MPELPEVHTTVEGLKRKIIGKTIKNVWSDFHLNTAHGHRQTLKNKNYYKKFRGKVVGAKIKSTGRIGKNILLNLSNGNTIIVHMKMTGHLMVENFEKEKKFIHLIFYLSQNKELALSDIRKFASIEVVPTYLVEKHLSLGPDPFKITAKEFARIISKRKNTPIKSTLMDQKLIAGIGNIYSDEILWQAGVHPLSKSAEVPDKKIKEIFGAMKKILRFSIKHGGDSHSDYRNISGEKGGFQKFHKAYGRKDLKCSKPKCHSTIRKTAVRGRSAHFCPKHQKMY